MCLVMGIVNVTPDSFSDGGKYFRPEEAIRRAMNLIDEGADIIDLGGESTRPDATPLGWEEEWTRLEPVVEEVKSEKEKEKGNAVKLSIDTYHPETAERAIKAGADIINCVYADAIPEMVRIINNATRASGRTIELVLPAKAFSLIPSSLSLSSFYLDPMIGFGTTREEDLKLLKSIPELAKKGRVLIGASRKRIVKKLTGEKVPGKDLAGNLAIAIWAAMNGASVVRVHDVKETVQALKVLTALKEGINGICGDRF